MRYQAGELSLDVQGMREELAQKGLRVRRRMIIDCHGHYTTAPAAHNAFRQAQLAGVAEPPGPPRSATTRFARASRTTS